MNITMINSVDDISITLDVEFTSETSKEKLTERHMTLSGRDVPYTYGNFNTYTIDSQLISTSDTLQINEWWENQNELFFTNYDQSTATVKITNEAQPIPTITWPYWNEFTGQIKLGAI